MWMLENAFIIPLIPALSFAVILFLGKRSVSYTHLPLPTNREV